jgi:single-strand DNA-binding protein
MLNQMQLIGHLGHSPSVRQTPNGDTVLNFSVATSERWRDKVTGDLKEETEWHAVSVFGKHAEVLQQYLRKGSQVYVSGKLKSHRYTDKNGIERISHGIVSDQVRMLGSKKPEEQGQLAPVLQSAQPPKPSASSSGFDDMDDDLPF